MPPSFETLELEIEEQVATVRLNRPDKANSMNAAMWEELQTCFEWLDQEPSVRAVILAGNGNHFCAGLDLAMFGDLHGASAEPARRAEHLRRTILRLQGNLTAIEKCRFPVLAPLAGEFLARGGPRAPPRLGGGRGAGPARQMACPTESTSSPDPAAGVLASSGVPAEVPPILRRTLPIAAPCKRQAA